jgi:hypothetical protein
MKDGVVFENPLRVGDALVYNPTIEQLAAAGYVPVADDPVAPSSRTFSTLKIVRALSNTWEAKKNILIQEGWYEQFNQAATLVSDGPVMLALFKLLNAEERIAIESKCLADDELCPMDEINPTECGCKEFVVVASVGTPTDTDERARTLTFPNTGTYFKSVFSESKTATITVVPPTVNKERPYVQWQLSINAVENSGATQFKFVLGNLDIVITSNAPAEYPTQLFEFYFDGKQTRCTHRSLIEHVINYGSEEA